MVSITNQLKMKAKKYKPMGLNENKKISKSSSVVAKVAHNDLEDKLKETVISNRNILNYNYKDDKILIDEK